MFYHSSIFKTHVNIFACIISNNCGLHTTTHHSGFVKAGFYRNFSIWIGHIASFKLGISSMLHYSPIFKTHVNICSTFISNNCSFHPAIHHSSFSKAVFCGSFNVWIGNFTFFKFSIPFTFSNCSIFKTNINISSVSISNNSSFHTAIHHSGFTKTGFSRSFNVWIDYFAFFKLAIRPMLYYSPVFKTDIDVCTVFISNNSRFHTTIHHSSFTKAVFSIWMSNISIFKVSIHLMFYYGPIFKTYINISSVSVSNNSSLHSAFHHPCFAKTRIKVWIGNFTFFKFSILFMLYYKTVFKTNIYISGIPISNNSSFHTTVHHACFAKTGSFYVWIDDYTFFKLVIRPMFYYFFIFETHINIHSTSISNNCGFHSAVHHSSFAKSIYFCYHKLLLAFCICSYPLYISEYHKYLFLPYSQKKTPAFASV